MEQPEARCKRAQVRGGLRVEQPAPVAALWFSVEVGGDSSCDPCGRQHILANVICMGRLNFLRWLRPSCVTHRSEVACEGRGARVTTPAQLVIDDLR